jgi:hypothetical protein
MIVQDRPSATTQFDAQLAEIAQQAIAITTWDHANIEQRLGRRLGATFLDSGSRTEKLAFRQLLLERQETDPEFRDLASLRIRHEIVDSRPDQIRDSGLDPNAAAWRRLTASALKQARTDLARDGIPSHLQDPDRGSDRTVPLPAARGQDPDEIVAVIKKARHDMQVTQSDVHGYGEKASVARLLYVHAPNAQMASRAPALMRSRELPEGHSLRDQFMDSRDHMARGDFSQAEHDARIARENASWMSPMISQSTRNLLGVGMPAGHSVVAGLMNDARSGLAQLADMDRRDSQRSAEATARHAGLSPDAVKRAGVLAMSATTSMGR